MVKDLPANEGDARDVGLIPGWVRSPGGGSGNPLLYSCLGNPMDRGAQWAAVHGVAESQTGLSFSALSLQTEPCVFKLKDFGKAWEGEKEGMEFREEALSFLKTYNVPVTGPCCLHEHPI